jgi:hypothetical protein
VALMNWALDNTAELLANPTSKGWMSRWIGVLKEEARRGFHPNLPKYGFGDPTSYGLIGTIVGAMSASGAVRHGAECFNFYFPQELDPDFLVVWSKEVDKDGVVTIEGFENPPWKTFDEAELRTFLLERAKEGYSFPINPVWPVRDAGWLEVLHALQQNEETSENVRSWFPPSSGVLERIQALHDASPNGFSVVKDTEAAEHSARKGARRRGSTFANDLRKDIKALELGQDTETRDEANLVDLLVRREMKARYARIRVSLLCALKSDEAVTEG